MSARFQRLLSRSLRWRPASQQANQNLVAKVQSLLAPGDTVAVLGLSYKPDTYIVEEAAGLYLAQQLKRHGHRVLAHDYAANPANAPALHEFEYIADPAAFAQRQDIRLAVICCPWPQYRDLKFAANTKVFTPWNLQPN